MAAPFNGLVRADIVKAEGWVVGSKTVPDVDNGGAVDDDGERLVDEEGSNVVELGISETAVTSLLVPTTVLRGLPLTATTKYFPAYGNVMETDPYCLSASMLKFANANPTSDPPCTNRRSKSTVEGSEAFRVQRHKDDPPTIV